MRLATFINGIRQEASETTSNLGRLSFGTRELNGWILETLVPHVRSSVKTLSPNDLVRGAIMDFMSRDASFGTNSLFIGTPSNSDIAFASRVRPDSKMIFCSPCFDCSTANDILTDSVIVAARVSSLKTLLRPRSISNLLLEAPQDPKIAIKDLPHLVSLLVPEAVLVFHGEKDAVDHLLAYTAFAGKLDIEARCELDDPLEDGSTRRMQFVSLSLRDPLYLSGPPDNIPISNTFEGQAPLDRSGRKGPYTFTPNDDIPGLAASVHTFVSQQRSVVVRPPTILDGPDGSDATWLAQFNVKPIDWLDPGAVTCPPVSAFSFRNACVVGTGPVFLESGRVLECSMHPMTSEQFRWWSVVHNADMTFDAAGDGWSARAAGKAYIVEKPCLLLADPGLPMHYHFLFDFLPRLFFRQGCFADFSIAVPDVIKNYQYKALINIYDIPEDKIVIYPTRDAATIFDTLVVTPTLVSDFWAAPEVVLAPRAGLAKAKAPRDTRLESADYIYVSRRDTLDRRRLVNEDEMVNKIVSLGFIEIFPGDYSLEEEMWIFSRAKMVVGPFGSGMANIIFCSPGARVIILQPNSTNWRILSFVMEFLKVDYGYVFGEAFLRSGLGHNTEWVIDVDKVVHHVAYLQSKAVT